jgi:hypothetical protein
MRGLLRSGVVVLVALAPVACSASANLRTPQPAAAAASAAPNTPLPSDPIAQAEVAFVGNPSQPAIKAALDKAFQLYKLQLTADNYSRAVSALVALRQDGQKRGCDRCTEMTILEAMVAGGGFPGMTFPEAAAFALTGLEIGKL